MNKHFHNLVIWLFIWFVQICSYVSAFFSSIQTKSERDGKTEIMREGESEGERESPLFGGLTSLRLTEAIGLLFVFLLPKNSKSS